MGWDEMRWNEARIDQIFWDETQCGMWSASVEHEVRVWSVKKMFAWRCIAMWSRARHVLGCSWTTTVQQVRAKHAFTRGPGWRTVLANSIGEKGPIIKSNATSAPPRAGTTGAGQCAKILGIFILDEWRYPRCSDKPTPVVPVALSTFRAPLVEAVWFWEDRMGFNTTMKFNGMNGYFSVVHLSKWFVNRSPVINRITQGLRANLSPRHSAGFIL